jgi:ribonuclease HI
MISLEGNRLRHVIHLHFPESNNVAEYEGLINGLRIAVELGAIGSTPTATPSWWWTKL